jgi:hypothetical protein
MMILEEELLEKIKKAKKALCEERLCVFIKQMFRNHIDKAIVNASIQDADNRERRDEVIENFRNAWSYGEREYNGDFDLIFLSEVAGRVEPNLRSMGQSYARLRSQSATLKGISYRPPADEARVSAHLGRVIGSLEERRFHPVEEAIFLYFHLARIQPFENGNKRTASIIQNLTLNRNKFPAVSISPHERHTYLSLLGAACNGFQQAGSVGADLEPYLEPDFQQRGLYDFLANKVLDNLLTAHDHLKKFPRYKVKVSARDPHDLFSAKGKVESWFRFQNTPHVIRVSRRDHELTVIGPISYTSLDKALSRGNGLNYEISDLD